MEALIKFQVDAYCDIITFATGAILKLGYDPIKAIEKLTIQKRVCNG